MEPLKKIISLLGIIICLNVNAQTSSNICMDFDGVDDWITLSPSPIANNNNFSVEMWFNSNAINTSTFCSGNFKRLFVLSGGNTRFEIGECGGLLNIFVRNDNGMTDIPITQLFPGINIRTGGINAQNWHHLAVTRFGNLITVYLDCVNTITLGLTGPLNPTTFRLGHYFGGNTVGQDWVGQIDDVRIWNYDLNLTEISTRKNCVLSGNETGLVTNWQFDDGLPGLNNMGGQVSDATGLGNTGIFSSNFTLNGNNSNYLNSTAGLVYPNYNGLGLSISDYPYMTAPLIEICNGEPAHFCLDINGLTPSPNPNVTLLWQYSDNGGTSWLPEFNPPFNDFCFAVPAGNLNTVCTGSPEGFVDRKYRAISQVFDPLLNQTCNYISQEDDLRICCPISPSTISIIPNSTLCENETLTVTVSLNSPDQFVIVPGSMTTIDWFYDDGTGPVNIGFANQNTFTYTLTTPNIPTPGSPLSICFSAEINHCTKSATVSECLTVDPEPICGNIIGLPFPNTLTLVTTSTTPHLLYNICSGNDAALGIDPNNPFKDCIPEWQYSFDGTIWASMGYSNAEQNTNILPTLQPPVPWPAGSSSIYYRVKCNPLSNPSGCDPCYSEMIEVQLKPDPMMSTIVGISEECKENLPVPLSVTPWTLGSNYKWFCDGLFVGTGLTYQADKEACYWVETSNGCITTESTPFCLTVCEVIPIISCPQSPNGCAQIGNPITLSASDSYISCDNNNTPLQFEWKIDGVLQSTTTESITHIPLVTGSLYEVTVTDPYHGCIGLTSRFVKPCDF